MQFKWNQEAYRAYACAALNGIFNLPELKQLLAEMAHPDCDHDRYVAIVRHITGFVGDIAGKMEFEERCERAE